LWYNTIRGFLLRNGFIENERDACVFNKETNDVQVTAELYVDDIMCTCKDEQIIDEFYRMLVDEYKDVSKKEGNEISYLGMVIEIGTNSIKLSMEKYIRDMLEEYSEQDLRVYKTPATGLLFERDESAQRGEEKKFHTIVAKLLYLCQRARPNIMLPVLYLCTRVQAPTTFDYDKLERVLGYLKGSIKSKRVLDGSKFTGVTAYIDAAFSCYDDGKGRSGAALMLGNTCVGAFSSKQVMTAKNSTIAEVIGLSDKIEDVEDLDAFLKSQGIDTEPPTIYQDNTSAIQLVVYGGGKQTNRHVRARIGSVKDMVDRKEVVIVYKKTDEMVADVLTKPLQGGTLSNFTGVIMGRVRTIDLTATSKHSRVSGDRSALNDVRA
jgi:hypothetical protein